MNDRLRNVAPTNRRNAEPSLWHTLYSSKIAIFFYFYFCTHVMVKPSEFRNVVSGRKLEWWVKEYYFVRHPYLPRYKSPTALSHMHHLTCEISSLLHSVNLILFTVILVHLILHISPHHLHSHHLSLPLHFTPDLKLHSHSYSFRTDFTDLNLYWIKGSQLCFSFWLRVVD